MASRLLASFFAAVVVASAFAYYNYKFATFKFIDFSEFVFYTSDGIFSPEETEYLVVIYNSRNRDSLKYLKGLNISTKVILIDYYQKIENDIQIGNNSTVHLKAGTNTIIGLIQRFDIYQIPVLFYIERYNNHLYKQSSSVQYF